jgi:hypothetical protein
LVGVAIDLHIITQGSPFVKPYFHFSSNDFSVLLFWKAWSIIAETEVFL